MAGVPFQLLSPDQRRRQSTRNGVCGRRTRHLKSLVLKTSPLSSLLANGQSKPRGTVPMKGSGTGDRQIDLIRPKIFVRPSRVKMSRAKGG